MTATDQVFTPTRTWDQHVQDAVDAPQQYLDDETKMAQMAKDLAISLRKNHWPEVGVPIDPFTIGARMGLNITITPLNPAGADPQSPSWVSGAMFKQIGETQPSVVIEESDEPQGQRFTMAHEIGHIETKAAEIGDPGRFADTQLEDIEYRHRYGATNYSEHQADLLAHLLLIPGEILMSRLALNEDVAVTAEYFNVTQTTALNRIKQLALLGI